MEEEGVERGGRMVKNQELGKQTADCRCLPGYHGEPKVYRNGLLKDECPGSYLLLSSCACFHTPRQWQLIHALPVTHAKTQLLNSLKNALSQQKK